MNGLLVSTGAIVGIVIGVLILVAVIAIATLFLTEIFFSNSVCALLFWFFLGVLLRLCHGEDLVIPVEDREI